MLATMVAFDEFAHQLQTALTHLYDPRYRPTVELYEVFGTTSDPAALQQQLIQAIARLQPDPATPLGARSWRLYHLLTYRYLQELTQEETAQKLAITPRHLRREQQQAIEALAQRLWDRYQQHQPKPAQPPLTSAEPRSPTGAANRGAWQQQLHQEIAQLQRHVPNAATHIDQAFTGLAAVGQQLATQPGLPLHFAPPAPGTLAAIHPSALRQVLLAALETLGGHLQSGSLRLSGQSDGTLVTLTIEGAPVTSTQPLELDLIQTIIRLYGGRVAVNRAESTATLTLWLPQAQPLSVLVVDDNEDLFHFYQRFTAQTRYLLTHCAEGAELFAAIQQVQPALIVLDVMLPDVDGWELLRQLRADQATATIPIIVCSVIQRAELALSLGATAYLTKPVGRQALLATLDQLATGAAESAGRP